MRPHSFPNKSKSLLPVNSNNPEAPDVSPKSTLPEAWTVSPKRPVPSKVNDFGISQVTVPPPSTSQPLRHSRTNTFSSDLTSSYFTEDSFQNHTSKVPKQGTCGLAPRFRKNASPREKTAVSTSTMEAPQELLPESIFKAKGTKKSESLIKADSPVQNEMPILINLETFPPLGKKLPNIALTPIRESLPREDLVKGIT